jgi:hypothetical protein
MTPVADGGLARRAYDWFVLNRRRLAPLIVVLAFALIGGQILNVWPHETVISYRFGPDHRAITEARVAYFTEGEEAAGASFHFADGAPNTLDHTVDLHPGRYTIAAELRGSDLRRDVSRTLTVPVEGVVRIDLWEDL